MSSRSRAAKFSAVTLTAKASPKSWKLNNNVVGNLDGRVDNQFPTEIYELQAYVKARFGMLQCASPSRIYFFTKIRSQEIRKIIDSKLSETSSAQASVEEVIIGVNFYDASQKSGNSFSGPMRNVEVVLDVDLS